jgi:putative DNA primase/helicase
MKRAGAGHGATTASKPPNFTTLDAERAFLAEVEARLGNAPGTLSPGELTRFDDPDGKRGNRACWCVLFLDGSPAGRFGNWRTGQDSTWCAGGEPLTEAERRELREAAAKARAERDRQRLEGQRIAAERARRMWSEATHATVRHPYVAQKRVPTLGVRELRGELLVPLRDAAGALWNVQRIAPDGSKRFLHGGRVRELFCLLAHELPETGELYLAEGWATAVTVARELRVPVAAAMNSGNLCPVAGRIRAARPRLALVLAADNDHRTPGNPGMTAAAEAARVVSGAMTWPRVCLRDDCRCTDFNDLANCRWRRDES